MADRIGMTITDVPNDDAPAGAGAGAGVLRNVAGHVRLPAVVLALGALIALTVFRHFRPATDFVVTYYLVSYDAEFLRRALLGSLLPLASEPARLVRQVDLAGIGLLALNALFVLILAVRSLRAGTLATAVLAILLSASPLTIGYFAWDLARPEQASYALTLGVIVAMLGRPTMPKAWLFAGAIAGVSVLGVLIHEGFVAIQLPLLLGVYAAVFGPWNAETARRATRARVPWGTIAAVTGIVAIAVVTMLAVTVLGQRSDAFLKAFAEEAARRYPDVARGQIMAHGVSLTDALHKVGDALANPDARTLKAILSIVVFVPVHLGLAIWAIRDTARRTGIPVGPTDLALGVLVTAAPLALCLVGIDFSRWAAYAVLNLLVFASVLVTRRAQARPLRMGRVPGSAAVAYAVALLVVLPSWTQVGGIDVPDPLQRFAADCLLNETPSLSACTDR